MLKKYKLVLLGLLAIGYGCVQFWVLITFSDSVLSRLRALEPQSATAVRGLPPGTPVLVEGRISRVTPQRYSTLVAYIRSSALRYSDKEQAVWVKDDWVAPALLLEVGGQTLPIEPGYKLVNTPIQKLTKRTAYNGFDRGSEVFVVGTVGAAGSLKAEAVYGGRRDKYLFSKTGEKWVGYGSALFVIVLGLAFVGVGAVVARRR